MKSIVYLITLTFIIAFSGCAGRSIILEGEMKNHAPLGADKIYKVASANTADSNFNGSPHVEENNEHKFLIQADALTTLAKGYKYFRIINPIDTSAEMITSPKELQNVCFDRSFLASYVDLTKNCSFEEKNLSYANIIAVYKERPSDALTINAQEVIDYLKEHDLLVDYKDYDVFVLKANYLK